MYSDLIQYPLPKKKTAITLEGREHGIFVLFHPHLAMTEIG
jgi:hypothetical protein